MQAFSGQRIFGLDVLRATAIVLVLFSSIYFIVPDIQGLILQLMSLAGVIGIEIFFVFSGFLIGRVFYKLYLQDDFSFATIKQFFIKRWIRVLPNYFLALVINIIIVLFMGSDLPHDLWKYFVFLQNFTSEPSSFFFYESWSISIGEFSAVVGPLLLYFLLVIKGGKNPNPKLLLFLTLCIIGVFLITKWVYAINDDVKTMEAWSKNLKTAVIYRIDAVYYGVLAAYISMAKPNLWKKCKFITLFLGLVLCFVLYVVVPGNYWFINTHPIFWNLWYLPLNSVIILLILPFFSQWKLDVPFFVKPIQFLSTIAYAVYVIHLSTVLRLMSHFLPSENLPKFDSIVYIMVYISVLILFGYLIHHYFERPIKRRLTNKKK
ncbi:acyltransferase family protein [Winogradskyella pulchriflava]|uniref:Acyltransferase family protein n=1 Tax=Winogradskyella pulchriflava TaxID=1110688 RepID=A0ABV6QBE9_9FLAO